MIGAGMWAAFLSARKPAAALALPLAFMVMMAFGAAAGFAGIRLPFSEAGVIASIFTRLDIPFVEIRSELNPLFPGINPEPILPHIKATQEAVVAEMCCKPMPGC